MSGGACLRLNWDRLDRKLRRGVEKTEETVDGNSRPIAAGLNSNETAWSAWKQVDCRGFPGTTCSEQLIHDIFGNPFQAVKIDPRWLTGLGGVVPWLARDIYDGRHWNEMPVLGDALEDAGCTDQAILEHCRSARTHARGCWVLDRLLGTL